MGKIELDHTGSGGGVTLSSDGTDLLLDGTAIGGGGGASELTFLQKSANYTITNGDLGKFIQNTTSSTITFDLPAVADISTGWYVYIQARSGECIIDSNISFGINFSTTFTLEKGGTAKVVFNGNNFYLFQEPSNVSLGGIALGDNAFASQSADATAIGKSTSATGSSAVALGSFSVSAGSGSVALRNSRAGGTDSLAAAIANNTSTYGATGGHSLAIGWGAKATSSQSVCIGGFYSQATDNYAVTLGGSQNTASGQYSVSISGASNVSSGDYSSALGGQSNTASGSHSIAMGQSSSATQANSIAIGDNATSTTANLIALGGTSDTVQISGTYTLPTTDGTNGQVLTTDGSGAVTFADAGGGAALELYAENPSSPTAPTVTGGTNSVAIGSGSVSDGTNSIAIGTNADSNSGVAIGYNAQTTSLYATAIGADMSGNGAIGAGFGSVALGASRAGGTDSFAAAIASNSASFGATGSNSVAIGKWTKSTNGSSVAIGYLGTSSGFGSTALGVLCEASQKYSVAFGSSASSEVVGKLAFSSGQFSSIGDSQTGTFVLRSDTTSATPENLTTDLLTAGTTNQIVLPNDSVYGFTGTVIAREDSSSTDDFAVWEIKGGAVRGASASTTALGSYNINKISESTGASNWSIALSADTTNGAVAITVTGEAAHNIRWVATVNTTEVTY